MSRPAGLLRRRGRYYVNVRVPKDLVPVLGTKHVRYSLETSDPASARSRVRLEVAKIEAQFAEARRGLRPDPATTLTQHDIECMALRWFSRHHRKIEEAAATTPLELSREEAITEARFQVGELSDPESPNTLASVQAVADQLLRDNNASLARDSREYHLLCTLVRRGLIESQRRGVDRLRGNFAGRAHDRFFAQDAPAAKADGERLSVVVDRWLAEREPTWAPSTRKEFRAATRMFMEAIGDPPIARIERADVREFKDLLLRAPVGFSGPYKGLKLPEAVEASASDPDARRLAPGTINKLLTALGSLFAWAAANGYRTGDSPVRGLRVALGKRPDEQRRPFTLDEMKLIFGSDLYRGGPPARRAERYWLPLLAAFTGCRLEELAQLHVADVRERDGVKVISINDEGDKTLKALSARRDVPLHSTLIEAGFLDYVKKVREDGHERMWPDLKRGARDSYGQAFGKWFSRWRCDLGITEPGVGFHAFRHSVAQALRDAGVELEVRNAVLGHSQGAVGSRYGSGVNLRQLRRAVERIRYPGLDMGHLVVAKPANARGSRKRRRGVRRLDV